MNVFLAGATGAVGRPLVRQLVAAGHTVTGTTRSEARTAQIRADGGTPVVVDAYDTAALRAAVVAASPDVVVHQLTDLSRPLEPGGFEAWVEGTNALRRDVTPALVDGAREAGATRVIAQSVSFMTAPAGPDVHGEETPLYLDAPEPLSGTFGANAAMEDIVVGARGIDGVVLRYGFFYGPGTSYAPDGDIVLQIAAGQYPVVGSGEGRFAFIHVDDAAAATVLALDGPPGIYNVVDDEPAPMRDWIAYIAELVEGPPPPAVTAETAGRDFGLQAVFYGTQLRAASNAKARRLLGFSPRYPDWRDGFRASIPTPSQPHKEAA